jgi:hypothetical protein
MLSTKETKSTSLFGSFDSARSEQKTKNQEPKARERKTSLSKGIPSFETEAKVSRN